MELMIRLSRSKKRQTRSEEIVRKQSAPADTALADTTGVRVGPKR